MSKYVVVRCLGEDCTENPDKSQATEDLRVAINLAHESADAGPGQYVGPGGWTTTHRQYDPRGEDGLAFELSALSAYTAGLGTPRVRVMEVSE